MKRGPYFFTQWRTHKHGATQHCYIWCQWEGAGGTGGVARSVTRHGLDGAIRAVIQAAEKRSGSPINASVPDVISKLEAMQ